MQEMASTLTKQINIIYNDDAKVIDFLSDLEDRSPITVLDESIKKDKNMKGCLVTQHIAESIFSMLVFNSPFEHNKNGNILMLFTHSELPPMISYFRSWLSQTAYKERNKRLALQNIISVLENCQDRVTLNNTQTNFMG